MFTPERHASWQGNIPYNRLITTNTAGYLKVHAELKLKSVIQQSVSRVVVQKDLTEAGRAFARSAQEAIGSIVDDLHDGQLSGKELNCWWL